MLAEVAYCHYLLASYANDHGLDPQADLAAARRTVLETAKVRGTMTPGMRELGVEIEIAAIRAAKRPEEVKTETWTSALALIGPLIDRDTDNPHPYRIAAEIYARRALWEHRLGKSNEKDVARRLELADKALAKSPRLAEALLAKGLLHLAQALASTSKSARSDFARRAREVLESAFREDPVLEREHKKALQEAIGLL